jgi:hypothetical protein
MTMMITAITLAMAMNMAAMKVDPQEEARKALNNCFVEQHNIAVSDKKSGAAFNEQLDGACVAERKAFFDLVVKAEMSYPKAKMADAEQYATEEIQSMVDSITSAFSENVGSGAKLEKEK